MTEPDGPDRQAADAEISALIVSLHETGKRLHELTGGQVDAVADGQGNTLLLQEAQTHMRLRDASRQAAILNALPANIALLDPNGLVVSVNEAWRDFAVSNVLHSPGAGVGLNYLTICDGASGRDMAESAEAAKGIRAVLAGNEACMTLEYPCHSPDEQRWFRMTVTPILDKEFLGCVVMHMDITQRKVAEEALRASEQEQWESAWLLAQERTRLVAAQRVAKVGDWTMDVHGDATTWSDEVYRIYEVDAASFTPGRTVCAKLVHPLDRDQLAYQFLASLERREPAIAEHRILLADGRTKHLEERWQVELDPQQQPLRLIGTCQDITEHKLAQIKILRLNRGYMVLSQISALMVRGPGKDELFQEACRIAVETGGFMLAWIGSVDPVARLITPIASVGADATYFEHVGKRLSYSDDAPLGHGPSAVSVRDKQPVVINCVADDSRVRHPEFQSDFDSGSLVSLPIIVAGEVVAVLCLQAFATDYFDEAEMKLLRELAVDIGFAIDHLGKSERLEYLAYYDALTGLANRSLFLERAGQCLRSAAVAGHSVAMVLLDIERFKSVTDSLGRPAGDELLRQVSAWLGENLVDATLLARLDADHFAMLLPESRAGEARLHLDRLIAGFHEHEFRLESGVFRIAAKFGAATYPDDATDADGLFKEAEAALKKAKSTGSRCLFYTQKMTESVARKLTQETQLRHALENEEFLLYYQPKVNLQTGKLTGAEALLRWQDPRIGLVPPGEFIPILEETGLIHEVGNWAIRKALADHARWRRSGHAAVCLAVNVSPLQLRNPGFVGDVRQLLAAGDDAAQGLELEITESMIMADIGQSIASLKAIRSMGVRIAIDDFGTGFSSLAYLAKLPVNSLKIDRSFIVEIDASPEGLSLVSTMISLAHSLNLKVVAEGVETEGQAGLLRLLRCDEMQGFLCSRPVPCEVFERDFLIG